MAEAGEARPRAAAGEGVCRPGAKEKPPSTVKPPPGEKARPPPPGDAPLIEERACFGKREGHTCRCGGGVVTRLLQTTRLDNGTKHFTRNNCARSGSVRAPLCRRRCAPCRARQGRDGDPRVSLYRLAAAGCFDAAAVPGAPDVVRAAADQESDRERGQVRGFAAAAVVVQVAWAAAARSAHIALARACCESGVACCTSARRSLACAAARALLSACELAR